MTLYVMSCYVMLYYHVFIILYYIAQAADWICTARMEGRELGSVAYT